MASIRKRGAYQWQARIIRKGNKALSKTFPTKQAAEDWAATVESGIVTGSYIDTRHLAQFTLSDLLNDVAKTSIPKKKGARQELGFISRLKLRPISTLTLTAIDSATIREYRDTRLQEVSPTTVKGEMAMLSSYYNYAISEFDKYRGLHNPVTPVRRPTPNRARTRRYDDEEIEWLLRHSGSTLLWDVLTIALHTAMRRSEIMVGTLIENIDLEHRTIELPDTKNGTSRTIAFPSKLTPIFERRIGERSEGRLFLEEADAPTRAFVRARNRARQAYEKECQEKGLTPKPGFLVDIRLHDARHEATTRLFEDHNLSIQEVSAMTGHKDPRMLQRYTHMRAQQIAQKLG